MKEIASNRFFPQALYRRSRLALTALILAVFLVPAVLYLRQCIGDIRPALFPPPADIAEIVEKQTPGTHLQPQTGEAVQFPLKLPAGFRIGIFAKNLNRPRDIEFSPGGTLLVSAPGEGGVRALPDKDGDGRADEAREILGGLRVPHGLAFHEGKLFVAEETQVARYRWDEAKLAARLDRVLFKLPPGGNHVTRSLVFNKKGQMFVSLGSTCNACYERHPWLAAVVVSDRDGNNPRLFARGLRNSVFLTVNPGTGEVWAGDMGRDFLGDDLPPEEINIIREGKNYGWPLCYGNRVHDREFDRRTAVSDPCAATEPPIFEYEAHAAPLGLTFIDSPQFPRTWQGDLLIAFHGSWNRSTPNGYKVVRMTVRGNAITGAEDFLTGFLQGNRSLGRPVDVAFDREGSLYVSDDKAGVIYKIIRK